MKKFVGYILIGIGLILIALSYPAIRSIAKIVPTFGFSDTIWMIAGIAVALLGAFISFRLTSEKQHKEVPIYHQEKVVGYRRVSE